MAEFVAEFDAARRGGGKSLAIAAEWRVGVHDVCLDDVCIICIGLKNIKQVVPIEQNLEKKKNKILAKFK